LHTADGLRHTGLLAHATLWWHATHHSTTHATLLTGATHSRATTLLLATCAAGLLAAV
jgi:hypothetical protein